MASLFGFSVSGFLELFLLCLLFLLFSEDRTVPIEWGCGFFVVPEDLRALSGGSFVTVGVRCLCGGAE